MQVKILDTFEEGDATGVLCRTNLLEYISALPTNYEEYFVQRGIVSNKYLDRLWETVSQSKHIPQIVLVSEANKQDFTVGAEIELANELKILDGLQRTKRLKVICDAATFIERDFDDDDELSVVQIARKNRKALKDIDCPQTLFASMVETKRTLSDGNTLKSVLQDTRIGLEIWFDLSTAQQIQKMLVLNAGHKSVNIKHQIELLFFSYLSVLQNHLPGTEILREREVSTISYSRNRTAGQFHFAHLISAFVSLNDSKAVTTNSDFSVGQSFIDPEEDQYLNVNEDLIAAFAGAMSEIDKAFTDDLGVKWIGREVVLVGILGAIGQWADELSLSKEEALERFSSRIDQFQRCSNLLDFESERNSLDLSKVNFGNKNKRAVFDAVTDFLKSQRPEPITWANYFRGGSNQ
jgi:hypothetical protein